MTSFSIILNRLAQRLRRTFGATPIDLSNDRAVGAFGEREAERFLRSEGYTVAGRNLRLRGGEIDLLCTAPDGRTLVVVEVKTRRVVGGGSRVPPEAAVTARKRAKLVALTRALCAANGWNDRPVRVDVVSLEVDGAGKIVGRRHFIDAVRRS